MQQPPSLDAQGFYPLSSFGVFKKLTAKPVPLQFPPNMLLSSNFYQHKWSLNTHRRLKNVITVMEWVPNHSSLGEAGVDGTTESFVPGAGTPLDPGKKDDWPALQVDARGAGKLGEPSSSSCFARWTCSSTRMTQVGPPWCRRHGQHCMVMGMGMGMGGPRSVASERSCSA